MAYRNGSARRMKTLWWIITGIIVITAAALAWLYRTAIVNAFGGLLGPAVTVSPSAPTHSSVVSVTGKALPKSATLVMTAVGTGTTITFTPGTNTTGYSVPATTDANGGVTATFLPGQNMAAGKWKVTLTASGKTGTSNQFTLGA